MAIQVRRWLNQEQMYRLGLVMFFVTPLVSAPLVQSDLEKVSALNARINEAKGKTLTEISRIVMDINAVSSRSGHLLTLPLVLWLSACLIKACCCRA
jgi:hypothetical protein